MQRSIRQRARLGVAGAALAASVAALAVCAAGASSATSTLTIGVIAPFSGPAAAYGPPEAASMQAAVNLINSQGGVKVGGTTYTLKLRKYDSAWDPTKAVTAARQAITQDGLKYLEVDGTAMELAVQPIAEAAHVVTFAVAGDASFIGPKHPLSFKTYYDIPQSLQASLTVLKPKLGKSPLVVSIYPDNTSGHNVAAQSKARAQKLGYRYSAEFVGGDVTDFNPVLTKVLSSKPAVIDTGQLPPSQYAVLAQQARQLGYKGKFVFDDTIDLPTVLKATGKSGIAGSVTSPLLENFTTAPGRYWTSHVGKISGGDPTQGWSVLPFDNLLLLKVALEKAGTLDTERVASMLGKVSTTGALGHLTYGGGKVYGLNRTFVIDYPVAMITAAGTLKKVATIHISS